MTSKLGEKVLVSTTPPYNGKKLFCCSARTGSITVACFYLLTSLTIGSFLAYLTAASRDPHAIGIFCASTVLLFLASAFNALLLYGAVKRKYKPILAWIIFEGIMIALTVVAIIRIVITGMNLSLCSLPLVGLRAFFLHEIRIYSKELQEQYDSSPPKGKESA